MIVLDTSALIAIVLREPEATACSAVLEAEPDLLISAGTLTEALIVAWQRGAGPQLEKLIDRLGFEIIPVTAADARRMAASYDKWGRGLHPAGLNFGDCFAYQLARDRNCPLLYIGNDFSRTDIASALAAG